LVKPIKRIKGSNEIWFDNIIKELRTSDRLLACAAMKRYMNQQTKSNCVQPTVAESTTHLTPVVVVLSVLLGIVMIWAVLATIRPKCLRTLKNKLILILHSCSKKTTLPPNLIELGTGDESDPTPTLGSSQDEQEPKKRSARRRNRTVCPYKRTTEQMRAQIKNEAYSDLRRLLRQAKLDVKAEMEAEAKMKAQMETEASAPRFEEN